MNLPTGVTKIEGFVADPEALFERLMADTVSTYERLVGPRISNHRTEQLVIEHHGQVFAHGSMVRESSCCENCRASLGGSLQA